MQDIALPDGLAQIDSDCFTECWSLRDIMIPHSVTLVGDHAFSGCMSLMQIMIPENVESIGSYAFAGCRSLRNISIAEGVASIGTNAFGECTALQSIVIPGSVQSIGSYIFSSCSSLKSAVFMARELSMDPSNFRQKHDQLMNGESSPTTLEALMELCVMSGYDINMVRDEHRAGVRIHPKTAQPCPYIDTMDGVLGHIRETQQRVHLLKDLLKLYKCAERFVRQMRIVCCGENTSSSYACKSYWRWHEGDGHCKSDCPCVRIAAFMDWLDMELSSLSMTE